MLSTMISVGMYSVIYFFTQPPHSYSAIFYLKLLSDLI